MIILINGLFHGFNLIGSQHKNHLFRYKIKLTVNLDLNFTVSCFLFVSMLS
jgi:hypothetical protein